MAISEGTSANQGKSALSIRALVLGAIGSVIITASSMYVALRLGALPWPIVFAALVSLFVLKALKNTSLNEVNVAHTAMSAGAMVSGGLAFVIPAIWISGLAPSVSLPVLLVVSLTGVIVGLCATRFVRGYFMSQESLSFPVGVSAAETLRAADTNLGTKTRALFSAMGLSALFSVLRDGFKCIPAIITGGISLPGSVFGLYASPMMAAMGYIIGPLASAVWFVGALIGDGLLVQLAPHVGIITLEVGTAMKSSLGLGLMFGCGLGVVIKQLLDVIRTRSAVTTAKTSGEVQLSVQKSRVSTARVLTVLACAAAALLISLWFNLSILVSICLIVGAGVCVVMAAQCAGATGVDPMEVFGVLMLLIIRLIFPEVSLMNLFLLAAIVTVACGLAGDTLNDFKVGQMFGTDPKDQWVAQCIGALIGAVVSAVVLFALNEVYGASAFGLGQMFVAAQSQVVAIMAAGVPHMPSFVFGLVAGVVLTLLGVPIMTLGLGVYLPLYLTLTVAVGGLLRFILERVFHVSADTGIAAASGVLGGESLVGVALAFLVMFSII